MFFLKNLRKSNQKKTHTTTRSQLWSHNHLQKTQTQIQTHWAHNNPKTFNRTLSK